MKGEFHAEEHTALDEREASQHVDVFSGKGLTDLELFLSALVAGGSSFDRRLEGYASSSRTLGFLGHEVDGRYRGCFDGRMTVRSSVSIISSSLDTFFTQFVQLWNVDSHNGFFPFSNRVVSTSVINNVLLVYVSLLECPILKRKPVLPSPKVSDLQCLILVIYKWTKEGQATCIFP